MTLDSDCSDAVEEDVTCLGVATPKFDECELPHRAVPDLDLDFNVSADGTSAEEFRLVQADESRTGARTFRAHGGAYEAEEESAVDDSALAVVHIMNWVGVAGKRRKRLYVLGRNPPRKLVLGAA